MSRMIIIAVLLAASAAHVQNPRIPGSGYICKDIDDMGRPTTECTKTN
jgi:hypothetical protein